uniref:Protein kinase domain-containing protein n=1 Tax=Trichuris muris TaxID=70415 RepID=A0A5S6QZR3_TRIMR
MGCDDVRKPADDSPLNDRWKIEEEIGTGGYGTVYKAFDLLTKDYVAIKMELREQDKSKCRLNREVEVYIKMRGNVHFPLFYCENETDDKHFIVIELLGPSVDVLLKQHGTFSLRTAAMVGYQCIETIRDLHNQGIVHGDIKTSNFAIGIGAKCRTIYLYDFGLCRKFRDHTGRIYPARERRVFRGTLTYASVSAQCGQDISRGDDLRSLFYMIYELIKGTLPWSKETSPKTILRNKLRNDIENMTTDLPVPVNQMGHFVVRIRFEETPNYNALLTMFATVFIVQGMNTKSLFD